MVVPQGAPRLNNRLHGPTQLTEGAVIATNNNKLNILF
jgi:hypothetical protein